MRLSSPTLERGGKSKMYSENIYNYTKCQHFMPIQKGAEGQKNLVLEGTGQDRPHFIYRWCWHPAHKAGNFACDSAKEREAEREAEKGSDGICFHFRASPEEAGERTCPLEKGNPRRPNSRWLVHCQA